MTTLEQNHRLLVAETFGPTFQGEGPSAGQLAAFIRLSRCNLSCPSCDTAYTWDWSRFDPHTEAHPMSAQEVIAETLQREAPLVVITGGEPLLQQESLIPVAQALTAAGRTIEIETNGTIPPHPLLAAAVARFNVSPKLASFAGPTAASGRRINPAALDAFTASGKAVFKFVVTAPEDLDRVDELRQTFSLTPIWIMPEGTTTDAMLALMRTVADAVLAHGWNLTSRLHVLLWGDQRGR